MQESSGRYPRKARPLLGNCVLPLTGHAVLGNRVPFLPTAYSLYALADRSQLTHVFALNDKIACNRRLATAGASVPSANVISVIFGLGDSI